MDTLKMIKRHRTTAFVLLLFACGNGLFAPFAFIFELYWHAALNVVVALACFRQYTLYGQRIGGN